MAKWFFEPGHTAAEFRARHMMVTWVRGHFKDVHGTMEWDPSRPGQASVEASIDARKLWSGEPDRDAHLKSADFLDVEEYPWITFKANRVELTGADEAKLHGELTIRGVNRPVTLDVRHLGRWQTSWWEDGVDKGPKTRINRHDFGVSWNSALDRGGIVVSDDVDITLDVEAILEG